MVPGKAAAQWKKDNGGWWYQHADGSYTTNDWESIDGEWYYFDAILARIMMTSSWIGNYYVKADGTMARSECVDENRYYVNEYGIWEPGKVAQCRSAMVAGGTAMQMAAIQ